MLPEILVEAQKMPETKGREQKGNGQSGGIDRQQKHAARNRVASRGQGQNGGKNRTDTRRPAKGESKAQQKAAQDTGFFIAVTQMHVAIQPARQLRSEETDDRKREKMAGAQSCEKRPAIDEGGDAESHKQSTQNDAGANVHAHQSAEQMQAEEHDERPGDRSEQCPVLPQKSTDGARRSSKRNENHREADDKRQGGSEKPALRLLALAQLLDSNAREHRNVARHQRKHARREKGNQSCKKCTGKRNIAHRSAGPVSILAQNKPAILRSGRATSRDPRNEWQVTVRCPHPAPPVRGEPDSFLLPSPGSRSLGCAPRHLQDIVNKHGKDRREWQEACSAFDGVYSAGTDREVPRSAASLRPTGRIGSSRGQWEDSAA